MSVFDKPTQIAILTKKIAQQQKLHSEELAAKLEEQAKLYQEMAEETSDKSVKEGYSKMAEAARTTAFSNREWANYWACQISPADTNAN